MVPIGKKPAPGDHESSLKIFLAKLFLARCPRAYIFQKKYTITKIESYWTFKDKEKSDDFNYTLHALLLKIY